MPCLLLLIGLVFPRLALILVAFFSHWFGRAFPGLLLPILGFIFLPYSMLWYLVVINVFHGQWGLWQILFMVLAVMADLGAYGGAARRQRHGR